MTVMELRQYTLHPGKRDELIELFEREFVDSQLALGITLPGLFRDLGDPDRFVWLRSFTDMAARHAALDAFYTGPVWRAHRDQANATMIDSDDVLLLRPLRPIPLVAIGSPVRISVHHFPEPASDAVIDRAMAAPFHGVAVTEYAENTYPRLPIRLGEHVLVTVGAGPDLSDRVEHLSLEPTPRSVLR